MNNTIPRHCNVLWLDTVCQMTVEEQSQLQTAGVNLLQVQNVADLKRELDYVDAVVIRLIRDIGLMEEVLRLLRGLGRPLPVICRVDRHQLEVGVQAMHGGAAHVLPSDDWTERGWRSVLLHVGHVPDVARSQQQAYVFVDPASLKLLELSRRVASAGVTTLLTGPTGAGKEVLARVLHDASPRRNGPFVALNCGAIPESMIEDLLFGHEKGAFTGAARDHRGLFEQAEGGSLFLDEIADMPYALQVKLLRVLQERQVTRLGAQGSIPVDVRLIAATNKDLRAAIGKREFREDLYFRLSTFRLRIPALSERKQDILPLARHLLQMHASDGMPRTLTEDAESMLLGYGWPGNVRELSNVMQRALVLSTTQIISAQHILFDDPDFCGFSDETLQVDSGDQIRFEKDDSASDTADAALREEGLGAAIRTSEHRVIAAALRATPNRVDAAKVLGISPRTLRYKLARLRDHGLSVAAVK